MNRQSILKFVFCLTAGIVLLALLGSTSIALAQDVSIQASIPGSIQPGTWYEQWSQPGTIYCPGNTQRSITNTSEQFTLTVPSGENILFVAYSTSRVQLALARASHGRYIATNLSSNWLHLLEVTRISPTQMTVSSVFYSRDGSCVLTNAASWTYVSQPQQPPSACTATPVSVAVNKRTGPGLNYQIVGQLQPGTSATVLNFAFDGAGRRWWYLADNTWVSSVVIRVQGNCPS